MTLDGNVSVECLLSNQEGTSDKIWGWVKTSDGNLFCFWGKRKNKDGSYATPRFKQHNDVFELLDLKGKKEKKGYVPILSETQQRAFVPLLADNDSLVLELTTARLSDTVK